MLRAALLISLLALPLPAALLPSPAGAGAAEPHLTTTPDGALVMSWLEPTTTGRHALKVATLRNGSWSAPGIVVERNDLFVNWADFPAVAVDAKGVFFAAWMQKSGSGTYSYDVRVAISRDGGKRWSESSIVHRDGKQAEHGFVSLAPLANGGMAMVWLDGRNMSGEEGDMTLRSAFVDAVGALTEESELDARVCECCATTMGHTDGGFIVAYRDRSATEVRDISIVRKTGRRWSTPTTLGSDNWQIKACPVNGPQLDARGKRVAIGWFTAAGDKGMVKAAFSSDSGKSFSKPIRVDEGVPVGRLEVVLLGSGDALVLWLEGAGGKGQLVMRRVSPNGKLGPIKTLAESSSARSSGFPRAARVGDDVYVAWTDHAAKTVRVAKLD